MVEVRKRYGEIKEHRERMGKEREMRCGAFLKRICLSIPLVDHLIINMWPLDGYVIC